MNAAQRSLVLPLVGIALLAVSLAVPSGHGADADPLAGSAIQAVLDANGGKVPASGVQLQQALQQCGEFVQLVVPFSAVALGSGLSNPRVLLTPRPGAVAQGPANRPNLEGRLFLAVNLELTPPADLRATSVEFISWNSQRRRFDFGVIEGLGADPQLKVVDGVRCFSCHKNHGPILGAFPWSNTTHNEVVRRATQLSLPGDKADGLALLPSQAAEFDAAVRLGASLPVNRDIFRLLTRDPEGQKTMSLLLCGIALPDSLEKFDRTSRADVNATLARSFAKFSADWVRLQQGAKPNVLRDFSPAGSVGTAGGWSGSTLAVTRYDIARLAGNPGLPSVALPSNPSAFVKTPLKVPGQPAGAVNATLLARTLGLTTGDRKFLADTLADAAKSVNNPAVTPATLARAVFEGFADGELPDRDEFKDRFVAGLNEVLRKTHGRAEGVAVNRADYASSPRFVPAPGEQLRLVPTTACLGCHGVRAEGKARFVEPIPALAFDPFDKAARAAWLKTADRGRRQAVLSRLLKRLAEDRDMPPRDAPEHDLFRLKDPAAFDEVKQFLESALKR